jgi:putative SOS response-associated peptidase YedK
MINARIETAHTSGAFKDAFASTRWLVSANGFYEWTKSPADGGKDPWHIFLSGHRAFSFAALWAYNRKLDITSCMIITAAAGEPTRQIHDRQPRPLLLLRLRHQPLRVALSHDRSDMAARLAAVCRVA